MTGSCARTCSRSPGAILDAQPAHAAISVRRRRCSSVTAPPEPYEWPNDQAAEQWPDAGGIRVFFDHFPLGRPIRAEEIPDDWTCPLCGVTKDMFEKVEG